MELRKRLARREASGVLTLIILILFVQTIIFLFHTGEVNDTNLSSVDTGIDTVKKSSSLTSLNLKPETNWNESGLNPKKRSPENVEKKIETFDFDPNNASFEDFIRLGLSEKQAAVIVKYRDKGGRFKKREDLNKIYILPEDFYERVKDHIIIENNSQEFNKDDKRLLKGTVIELNRADSLTLISLPGIGPYYASKILDFRKRTGGFAYPGQLMDIKGIDSVRFNSFKELVTADSNLIVKKDIALATGDELSVNPYIGAYLARAIVRYIGNCHENFSGILHLAREEIIKPELLKILRYYFH